MNLIDEALAALERERIAALAHYPRMTPAEKVEFIQRAVKTDDVMERLRTRFKFLEDFYNTDQDW